MKFNLNKIKKGTLLIANSDAAFIGTALELQEFTIEVQKLSRADKIDVAGKAVNSDGEISNGQYSQAIFCASIVAVDGIDIVNDNGDVYSDEELKEHSICKKEFLWEIAPNEMIEEIKRVIASFDIEEVEKKSDLEVTQIG